MGLDICASGTSDTESESDENESEAESSVSSVCGELLEADDEGTRCLAQRSLLAESFW